MNNLKQFQHEFLLLFSGDVSPSYQLGMLSILKLLSETIFAKKLPFFFSSFWCSHAYLTSDIFTFFLSTGFLHAFNAAKNPSCDSCSSNLPSSKFFGSSMIVTFFFGSFYYWLYYFWFYTYFRPIDPRSSFISFIIFNLWPRGIPNYSICSS